MVFRMQILIATTLYVFIMQSSGEELMEDDIVNLQYDSFATELEKMPHFVMFSYWPSSE